MALFSYENLVDPILRSVRQEAPEFAGMQAGDRVLDVCCGTGAQVIEYGRRGILAVGIDIDKRMLDTALKNKKRLDAVNTSFSLADATALPFDDDSFDYVSISFALHDKERAIRNRVISEMKRIVKPEGALVLIDYSVPLPRNFTGIAATVIEFFAGGSHYRGFEDFTAGGGLENIIKTHKLKVEKLGYYKNGMVAMVKVRVIKE
jgi:ubiquinone/menaquinone biosynthesis C-methylase UbiE